MTYIHTYLHTYFHIPDENTCLHTHSLHAQELWNQNTYTHTLYIRRSSGTKIHTYTHIIHTREHWYIHTHVIHTQDDWDEREPGRRAGLLTHTVYMHRSTGTKIHTYIHTHILYIHRRTGTSARQAAGQVCTSQRMVLAGAELLRTSVQFYRVKKCGNS